MAVVVLTSGGACPGVTTTALGLTLRWPRSCLLVDADREPTQATLAGYLGGTDPAGQGLTSLAAAFRDRTRIDLLAHSLPLAANGTRAFVPGFATPAAVGPFADLWTELGHTLSATSEAGWDVIVDAGRVGPTGLPRPLVAAADAVLLTLRSSLRSLAAARLYAQGVADQVDTLGRGSAALLVIGPRQPYSSSDIADTFGLPVWAEIAADADRAAVLSDGLPTPRRFDESPLLRSYAAASADLVERIETTRALVAGAAA